MGLEEQIFGRGAGDMLLLQLKQLRPRRRSGWRGRSISTIVSAIIAARMTNPPGAANKDHLQGASIEAPISRAEVVRRPSVRLSSVQGGKPAGGSPFYWLPAQEGRFELQALLFGPEPCAKLGPNSAKASSNDTESSSQVTCAKAVLKLLQLRPLPTGR